MHTKEFCSGHIATGNVSRLGRNLVNLEPGKLPLEQSLGQGLSRSVFSKCLCRLQTCAFIEVLCQWFGVSACLYVSARARVCARLEGMTLRTRQVVAVCVCVCAYKGSACANSLLPTARDVVGEELAGSEKMGLAPKVLQILCEGSSAGFPLCKRFRRTLLHAEPSCIPQNSGGGEPGPVF